MWEPSTRVNKLLYKMLLFLLNVVLMNHFCILMTCILNILLEWYFMLQSHNHVTDEASIKNMELNPAFHLLMWILPVQKGQSGFHSWHPCLCCFFFQNAILMSMAGRQQKAVFPRMGRCVVYMSLEDETFWSGWCLLVPSPESATYLLLLSSLCHLPKWSTSLGFLESWAPFLWKE